ncbi:MAG: porin [Flavobacteriales bacterium]
MIRVISLTLMFFCVFKLSFVEGQSSPIQVFTKREKGIELIQKDSLFSLQFQFRMQNRAGYLSNSLDDLTPEQFEFRVRRLRMRFKGFVIDPRINYYIQLSFSRGDMDWDDTQASTINNSPNVVRDAVISYQVSPKFQLSFGQTKLPGNRQRVISSGNLQFADRSIVNATFNIDRDFGFFANYSTNYFNLKGALTSGEGRNSSKSTKGLNYTGRLEVLPFGKFSPGNDECEGDLARESKPKVALAATYNFNDDALRTGGTLGNDLYAPVDLRNIQLDAVFKYKGFSFYQEYLSRSASQSITVNDQGKTRNVYVGFGVLSQCSYNFKNNVELALRLATVTPNKAVYDDALFPAVNEKRQEQWQFGITKYLYGHRLKVQGNLLYHLTKDLKSSTKKSQVGAIFQVELGI